MPTVPTLNPTVRTEALPGARLSGTDPGAMGANLGRGIQQLGGEMAQWAADERRKKIETDVTAAVNNLDAASANGIRLARDPKNGIKGATAKDDLQRFTEDFDKREKEYAQGLVDPEAKRLYSLRAMQRRNAYAESLMSHADGVVFGYQNDQDQQTAKLADERAGLNYDNPNELATARADKEAALARLAERNGWSPERLAAEKLQATSSMHQQVMRGYLAAGRVTEAEQYFQTLKPEEMTAQDRTRAQEVITQQNDTAKAQGFADQAHTLVRAGMLKPTEVEDWLKEQTGGNVRQRDDARSRFKVLESSYNQAVQAEVGKASDDALRIMVENDGDITAVKNDPDIMATLTRHDPEKIKELEKVAASWQQPENTDDFAQINLTQDARSGDLGKMDWLKFHATYRGRFSKSDWENLAVPLYLKATDPSPGKRAEMQEFVTVRDQIDNAMVSGNVKPFGIKPSDLKPEQAKSMVDFETEANRRLTVAAMDPRTGEVRKLNGVERQQVLNGMVMEKLRADGKKQLPPWARTATAKEIRKSTDLTVQLPGTTGRTSVYTYLRDRGVSLTSKTPSDEVIARAFGALQMGASDQQLDDILRGK